MTNVIGFSWWEERFPLFFKTGFATSSNQNQLLVITDQPNCNNKHRNNKGNNKGNTIPQVPQPAHFDNVTNHSPQNGSDT